MGALDAGVICQNLLGPAFGRAQFANLPSRTITYRLLPPSTVALSLLALDDQTMLLTNREFRLIEKLAGNSERVVSHEELLDDVWGNDLRSSPKALEAVMSFKRRLWSSG